jgi:hypothetical protein
MKAQAWLLAAALLGAVAGCEESQEAPETAAARAETSAARARCRQLLEHIVQITPRNGGPPETDPARVKEIVARIPIEDVEQCATVKDQKVLACMQAARDVPALLACIPNKAE